MFAEEIDRQVERDILNAWEAYENALLIVESQYLNIATNEENYERTAERYKLGNSSITTYREAQVNLLNARLGLVRAIYQAKVFEIQLLQLAGQLVAE